MPDNKNDLEERMKKYEHFSQLLDYGLRLSEELMLKEKAARGEDVVISVDGKNIIHVPAQKILDEWDKLMDQIDIPEWKNPNSHTEQ